MSEHWKVLHASFEGQRKIEDDPRETAAVELECAIIPMGIALPEAEQTKHLQLRIGASQVVLSDSELAEFLIWTRANL